MEIKELEKQANEITSIILGDIDDLDLDEVQYVVILRKIILILKDQITIILNKRL